MQIELRGDLQGSQIENFLLGMRRQRFGLVQTPEQLRFAYLAIAEGIERVHVPSTTSPPVVADVNNSNEGDAESVESSQQVSNTKTAPSTASEESEEPGTAPSTVLDTVSEPPTEATAEPAEDTETVAQPPCKRQAEDEPAVDDQPQAKRPAIPGSDGSLNSLGQAESRRPDASIGNSEGCLPGQTTQPAAASEPSVAASTKPIAPRYSVHVFVCLQLIMCLCACLEKREMRLFVACYRKLKLRCLC